MLRNRIVRALAALIVGAAGGAVVSSGVAFAAACPAGTGVTVVVNSSVRCDGGGGGSAFSNFGDAGHSLTRAKRQPGFVCRIDGAPASDPCVNASPSNAYWGLFWSDGKSGTWSYASSGADGLSVPSGGWVAFVFQTSSGRSYPPIKPYTAPPAPAPKPKPKPTPKAVTKPKTTSSSSASKATPTPSASAGAAASAGPKGSSATPSPSASASATAAAEARKEALQRTSQRADDSSTSTLWVGSLLALTLLIGMGVTIWQRRVRRS